MHIKRGPLILGKKTIGAVIVWAWCVSFAYFMANLNIKPVVFTNGGGSNQSHASIFLLITHANELQIFKLLFCSSNQCTEGSLIGEHNYF